MTRDSLISSATSTTYPSTLSSFDNSALGLTDSPRHASSARSRPMSQPHQSLLSPAPLTSAAAGIAPPASPSLSPWRRRRTRTPGVEEADPASQGKHRPVPQSTALQDHPKMTAPPPVPRKYSHPSIRTSHSKSSFQVVSEGRKIEHKASSERVSQDQPRRTVRKQRSGLTEQSNTPTKTQALGVEPQNPRASTPEAKSASKDDDHRAHDSSGRSIAIPVRRQAQDYGQTAQTTPSKQKPARAAGVATPSHRLTQQDADDSLARQWESELLKAAGDLRLDHQGDNLRQHREELRRKDREWENSGTWESTQDAAKRAEERTRREASREIAYPPMQPRAPIRAAPSGVTSVHVGVRPRVHPSRVDESTNRNQPDPSVPVPLFLPSLSLPDPLPGEDTVKGSYNTRYTTELMDKARAEYEAWLGGKSEREGGIGDDQGGVGDFIPRNRHVALPKAVGGQTPMESWDEPRKTNKNGTSSDGSNRIATPLEGGFPWNGYGYLPDMIDPSQAFNGANMQIPPGWTQDDLARWYASQAAYWNPYWWSQAMQNPQVTESQQDEVSEVNKPAAGKVHFAESPDKTRLNPKSSAASLHQDYVDQGMYSDP
ncbi:hypothetical protein BD324DRAFT_23002 [Kockovaella imperatae]|uniref:Uncharacterized protein n=1 Tax=Kockovaella imperatae TaxID=4999 RepID=A0A1Y1UUG1_9TREE|nr:hypothetical protein BD324DRAFT_23002 [Kockovaella imperatae]ORX40825.1 hypothetical protein BD324DRAFT_23002 [Kockovaella imperatae]